MQGNTKYRQDIDGLRALAVLAVVVFHIQEHWLPGGFVGVDMFFVISGYLISQQLYKQVSTGTFSLSEFYRRRIMRIIPAMIGVVAITMIAAQFLFRPIDAEVVAKSALWSTASLGNLYFWLFQDTSYFASSSLEIPLLHLWSLGVEEQFYVFWPLMLWVFGASVLKKRVGVGIVLLIIASTWLAEVMYPISHSFTYYMLPTRAGELMVGAMAAFWVVKNPSSPLVEKWASPLQWVGLCMVILSIALFDPQTVFPGIAALLPTVGVASMLLAGQYKQTKLSAWLSCSPMRFFGLISYSLYLWHWPVLAFYRYGQFEINVFSAVILFGVITVFGYLSYRFVETPFRHSKDKLLPLSLKYYFIPGGLIIAVCLFSMKTDGMTVRALNASYVSQMDAVKDEMRPAYHEDYVCQVSNLTDDLLTRETCVLGDNKNATTLLLGDSNAAHFIGVWGALSEAEGGSFRNVALGGCPLVDEGIERYARATRLDSCRYAMPKIFELAETMETLVVSSSWTDYQARDESYIQAVKFTLVAFADKGINVVIFGKVPIFEKYDRRCAEKSLSFPGMDCTVDEVEMAPKVEAFNQMLQKFAAEHPLVFYRDVNDLMCTQGMCSPYGENGRKLYFDRSHLNVNASWEIGEKWAKSILENDPVRDLAKK